MITQWVVELAPVTIALVNNVTDRHTALKLSYSEAFEKSGLVRLDIRREEITQNFKSTFGQVKCPTHPLQGFHFSDDVKTDLPLFSSKV